MNIARLKATSLQTLAPLKETTKLQSGLVCKRSRNPNRVQWVKNNNRIVDWSSGFHDFDDTRRIGRQTWI